MNLQHLKYAIEVEKTGSISKAAENLCMNQPNLSKAIKELESMIGVPLFNRSTKGISATTKEGQVFMEYAKNILAQLEDMNSYFHTPKKNVFRVSIPRASYIAEAFTFFVNELYQKDEFYINLLETNSLQSIQNVTRDGYDLGVIRYRNRCEKYFLALLKERELDYQEILSSDGVVVMGAKNPLSEKPELELSDLDTMVEVVNDDFALPPHMILDKSKAGGEALNRKQIFVFERGSQFDILFQIRSSFMWAAPMPQAVLKRNDLIQKKCRAKDIGFKDVLIYQRGRGFGELEKVFLEKLGQVKASLELS